MLTPWGAPLTRAPVKLDLLDVEDLRGGQPDGAGAHWLQELAGVLVSQHQSVEWWHVVDERSLAAIPTEGAAPEGTNAESDGAASGLATTGEGMVHHKVARAQLAARLVQEHLLPRLQRYGTIALLGHGIPVAHTMIAVDQRLRAAGVRDQVLLFWLAPSSLDGAAAADVDWEALKRACSIVAPNPNVGQALTARRVGSMVVERGSEGARRFLQKLQRRYLGAVRSSQFASPPMFAC
jgi:hypothetical protein